MKTFLWLLPVVVLAGLVAYFLTTEEIPLPQPSPPTASPVAKPAISYPVEPVDDPEHPLPSLAESDSPLNEALLALLGQEPLQFLQMDRFIHRFVATVDSLPRDYVSTKLMPVKPVPGISITETNADSLALSNRNAERYQTYMRLLNAIPVDAAVNLYARYYPLFQEQYESLGYPDKYFNDRVIEVIDHLLATPEVQGPLHLVQPRVLYEFADPKLENLSAGQKVLLRMGPDNRLKLKAKLREIRHALVSMKRPNSVARHAP